MSRLNDRRIELAWRQNRRRKLAVEIGEATDQALWAQHLTVFCRLGRKRKAVERKMALRGDALND